MSRSSNFVFDDIFQIEDIDKDDKDKKRFERGTSLPSLPLLHFWCNQREILLFTYILVSRLFAKSTNYDMQLTLDYNIELYPLKIGDVFSLVLASSLARGVETTAEGEDDKDIHQWRPDGKGRRGIEEDYEYVMFGKVSWLVVLFGMGWINAHFPVQIYKFDGDSKDIL